MLIVICLLIFVILFNLSGADAKIDELQILYNAALILQKKLNEIPDLNLPWPPLASDLTMENVREIVPCEFYNFLLGTSKDDWFCLGDISFEWLRTLHVSLLCVVP